jgi:hypothetical protein
MSIRLNSFCVHWMVRTKINNNICRTGGKYPAKSRRVFYNPFMKSAVFGSFLAVSGLALFLWASWPIPDQELTLSLPPISSPNGQPENLTIGRTIQLKLPTGLRDGEQAMITLELIPGQKPETWIAPDGFNPVVEAHLDMNGCGGAHQGTIREGLGVGKTTRFDWPVQGQNQSACQGTIWLYWDWVSQTSGQTEPQLLMAKNVTISAVNVGDFSIKTMRIAGVCGLVLGCWIAISALVGRYKRRSISQKSAH